MRRFTVMFMLTKRLVDVFGKNYVVKRSGVSVMLVVKIAVARLLAEGRLVSPAYIEERSQVGHWENLNKMLL